MKRDLTFLFLCLVPFLLGAQSNNFYATDQIQEVRISFSGDNWKYLLDSLRYNGDELLTGAVNINGTQIEGAGIRYRDGRSFTPNGRRNGLYINLGQNAYEGYNVIDLSSALRDPSLVREVLASEIAGTYFDAPQANFAKVYINDELYGLFVNKEAVAKGYLERVFGESGGALAMPHNDPSDIVPTGCIKKAYGSLQEEQSNECNDNNWISVNGSLDPVMKVASALSSGDATMLANNLDIDATLWMLAFNNVIVNLSSYSGQYSNNYYLYQKADGQVSPILGDLNLAFGSFKNPGVTVSDLRTPQLMSLTPDLHKDNEKRPLISKILSNDMYYKQYLSHMRSILVEWVLSGKLENRARALQSAIAEARGEDDGQYYSADEHGRSLSETIGNRSRIPGLVRFMDGRGSFLESNEVYTMLPPVVSNVAVEGRERFSSTQINEFRIHAQIDGFPKSVYLYYRFGPGQEFQMTNMLNDGEHYDDQANDAIFGAIVKPKAGQDRVEYYIMVENAKTVSYSPAQYNFEHYSTTLREVNK